MVNKIYDSENDRTIVRDFNLDSLTIIGDYSSTSLSSYWVVNRLFTDKPFGIYIIKEGAIRRCRYLNKLHKSNDFIVVLRPIFVC